MTNLIDLNEMHERHRALTPSIAGSLKEAATVCLSRHHNSPILIVMFDGSEESKASVAWAMPGQRERDAWANAIDATELGACGCVIAAVEALRGLYAVRRAETGTGADYYIGPPGAGENDVEDCLRLEVSGVDSGDPSAVTRRLLAKVQQAQKGRSNLPALAGVIGFKVKLLMLKDVAEEL